jgi:hypothetical protein
MQLTLCDRSALPASILPAQPAGVTMPADASAPIQTTRKI